MTPLIFAMPGSEAVAEKLASTLSAGRGTIAVRRFPDGESYVQMESAMKGRRVAVVCTLDRPDDRLIPPLLLAVAARENGATDVGPVTPCLAYVRQGSCFQPGGAVSARYFTAWLSRRFDWLAAVDPHLHRITKSS